MSEEEPLIIFYGRCADSRTYEVQKETGQIVVRFLKNEKASDYLSKGSFRLDDFFSSSSFDWAEDRPPGPSRLRTSKGGVIWIDFLLPEDSWQGKTQIEFAQYYADGLEECFRLLTGRAQKLGTLINPEGLEQLFAACVRKIRTHEFGNWPWGAERA
jgi:hypothetical protein